MTATPSLGLPLVLAAQAQKHVTINEALLRLDTLVQLRLQSMSLATPPADATDGLAWSIAANATDAWAGHEGRIAIHDNGGWVFADALPGWTAWVVDRQADMQFDGAAWVDVAAARGPQYGAALQFHVMECDHVISSGGRQVTAAIIPSHSMVFGVTARVVSEITGSLSSWRLGTDASDDRFGSGLGLFRGDVARGILGVPFAEYAAVPLEIAPENGEFLGGRVRLAVHFAALTVPAEG